MENLIKLVAAKFIQKNLDWYLLNGFVNIETANLFNYQIDELIKSVGKYALNICEGFGIPPHVIHAPIYTGYQEYYKEDISNGEHYRVIMRPKF